VFKTSRKAILDVALIHTGTHLLDTEQRRLLQKYSLALENQLLGLPEVNSINRTGYFLPELQIRVKPEALVRYDIPLSLVRSAISQNHARQPAGHIEARNEPKVTINAQLDTIEKLKRLYVQAGFQGRAITLGEIAEIEPGFDVGKEIIKVNGHSAIMLNVVKTGSHGIVESIRAVEKVVEKFRNNHLGEVPIDAVLLDDESIDVRNRLHIISINGLIGFALVLMTLFLFLSKRAGFWVAMGIPFTIAFTLLGGYWLGYTINNTTLAAVIIVMGIVVDDAIVVAENIGRLRKQGLSSYEAAVHGTSQVFMPVLAAVITTCIAFVPLFFFSGRYGAINVFIPPIIFLMLTASLIESLFILPGHLNLRLPFMKERRKENSQSTLSKEPHWFDPVEGVYGRVLERILPWKGLIFLAFVGMLIFSGWIVNSKMKFVLFPHEETRDIVISGECAKDADRFATAEATHKMEDIFRPYLGKEVVGYRTEIARSRRGGDVQENRFRTIVEIVPKEQRSVSADQLVARWKPEIDKIGEVKKYIIQKSRWGHSSGSPIEIVVQENLDSLRAEAAGSLADAMRSHSSLVNVEIDEPIKVTEYKIDFLRKKMKRLSINPTEISQTIRAALEGLVLYEIPTGDEETEVRLSVVGSAKDDIGRILEMPVANNREYLVPLKDVVTLTETRTPSSISRRDGRRSTVVYADMKKGTELTPLDIAREFEDKVFPDIISSQPSTTISFAGEIFDTRESQRDFRNAIIMVVFLVFVVLALTFNSLSRALVIMLAIPFGVVGVVLAFWLHGKVLFGFFAAIGALGLAGVVINDSIIMLSKLDREYSADSRGEVNGEIARIAQTRLKAVVLTTITTVAAVMPTAYGLAGYDAMLAEMMLALSWGLIFGTLITLLLVPCIYGAIKEFAARRDQWNE
jgi:multidrug efflux pump subunit AcrB